MLGGPTPVFTFPAEIPTQPNFEIGFAAPAELFGGWNRFELLEADAPAIVPVIESPPVTSESHAQKPKKSYYARKRAKLYV